VVPASSQKAEARISCELRQRSFYFRKANPDQHFMQPKLTSSAKGNFQRHLALYFFVTGSAFQRVEDDNLKAAIKVLRLDDVLLPDRKRLSGALLEQCYAEIKA
jgi:hypothetical protein